MNTDGLFKIALFPIPGCVSFPHTIVPLHVFEPRYRQMIEDCVSQNLLLGVCHTKSIERLAFRPEAQISTKEELYKMYKQNLTTFSPEDVFSAGSVELKQKTEDGRYMISIYMLKRLRLLELSQQDPYKIAICEEYRDQEIIRFEHADQSLRQQRQIILDFIKDQISKQSLSANDEFNDLEAEETINDFTFKLFKFYRMQEHLMQKILNTQDPAERLLLLFHFTESLK